jgi:hypothetical protein
MYNYGNTANCPCVPARDPLPGDSVRAQLLHRRALDIHDKL